MKDHIYKDAVDHLRFSNNLVSAVLEKADRSRRKFSVWRVAAIMAVVCILFASTVFASEMIVKREVRTRKIGKINGDFSETRIMAFSDYDNMHEAQVYRMELRPKGYYHFGDGMIYHPSEGFLQVTQDYELQKLADFEIKTSFEKNGKHYELDMKFTEVDGGVYSNLLMFYPVENDEILLAVTDLESNAWPVYVNIKTGVCRDALPEFTEADFLPEELESGYDARVSYSQPFRNGILMSCLFSGMRNGNTDSTSLRYWIPEGSQKAVKLDLPKNFYDDVIDDTLYYQDREGFCYVMDDNFRFHKIKDIGKTTDSLNCGLLTVRGLDGSLEIVDIINEVIYNVQDIQVSDHSLWDTTGYNATRHSAGGKIVVTHSYGDYEANNRPVDRIAYLDVETGELKQLQIDSNYRVQTHGWLDDERYCVIYEDGLNRFLSVYEFH